LGELAEPIHRSLWRGAAKLAMDVSVDQTLMGANTPSSASTTISN